MRDALPVTLDLAGIAGHIPRMTRKDTPSPICPICKQPTAARWRPFCSKRCADVDLGRWLTGHYAVPAEEEPVPDGESGPDDR